MATKFVGSSQFEAGELVAKAILLLTTRWDGTINGPKTIDMLTCTERSAKYTATDIPHPQSRMIRPARPV